MCLLWRDPSTRGEGGLGVTRAGSNKPQEVGSLLGYLTAPGGYCVGVGQWSLCTNAAPAPWRPSRAGAGDAALKVTPKTAELEGARQRPMWEMHRTGGTRDVYRTQSHAITSSIPTS